jgi:integrase
MTGVLPSSRIRARAVFTQGKPASDSRRCVSAQPWFAPAVRFAANTGARRGETLAVRWQDIDFEQQEVTISRSLCQTKKGELFFKAPKDEDIRIVAMPLNLVDALRKHRLAQGEERKFLGEGYRDQDLVFAAPDGSPILPWSFTASFRYLVKRAEVPYIRLHGIRDTHASLLGKHGVGLEVNSKRLGHSEVGITAKRYVKVYRQRDTDAAATFDRIVS